MFIPKIRETKRCKCLDLFWCGWSVVLDEEVAVLEETTAPDLLRMLVSNNTSKVSARIMIK